MTTNSQIANGSHADDGELLALLDEQPMAQRSRLDAHVAQCERCASRLDRLRIASGRVSSAVSSIDIPPLDVSNIQRRLATVRSPRSRTSVRFTWRAAAVVVLAAGIAAASPLRGWVVSRVQRPSSSTSVPRSNETAAPSLAQPAASSPGAVIWFSVTGSELAIRFVAVPAAGTLELVQSADPQASAQIADGGNGEALLILPGEVRVRNAAASTADYRVTVPSDVHSIRLSAGDVSRSIVVTRGSSQKIRLDAPAW